MATRILEIIDGDPKEKLLPQLADIGRVPYDDRPSFRVRTDGWYPTSNTKQSVWYELLVFGLEADEKGESWKISGTEKREPYWSFTATYNTRRRTGSLIFRF